MNAIPEHIRKQIEQSREQRRQLEEEGVPALTRLLKIARGDTGQSRKIALFLLGLYNDTRFPFPLTELRSLDGALFQDCMAVLNMDARACRQEVHCYFENGDTLWEQLAKDWNVRDYTKAYRPQ